MRDYPPPGYNRTPPPGATGLTWTSCQEATVWAMAAEAPIHPKNTATDRVDVKRIESDSSKNAPDRSLAVI